MPRTSLFLVSLAALTAAAAPAHACTVLAEGVAFGTYDPKSNAPHTGFGRISLDCHPSGKPVISIGAGLSGNLLQRRMRNGASTLDYNLYTDAGLSRVWGDGTGGTLSVPAPKKESTFTVYGRIPAGQNVRAGSYSDVLVVSVIF